MKPWLSEYSSALEARNSREQGQVRFINAYTQLADRTASLVSPSARVPASTPASPALQGGSSSPGFAFGTKSPAAAADDPNTNPSLQDAAAAISRLRADLASTQKSRSALDSQLKPLTAELATLKAHTARDASRIASLEKAVALLERRVRDRDSEIKGKQKIIEDVHDEMATLELQLNVAEEGKRKLERENGELVERWMKRMGEEAEEMNRRSNWE